MDKEILGVICKVTATTTAGLFAGSGLGSNFTAMPAMLKIQDTAALRMGWKHHFLLGKQYMGRCAQVSFLAGCSACYLDNTDLKYYWLAGAVCMCFIFPFTAIVMYPDIQKLLKDDVIETRGVDWVRSSIDTWDKRHFKRSMAASIAFGIFLYAFYNRQ